MSGDRKPIWELTFRLEDGSTLTCLEEATSGDEAFEQITSVWGPPSPIVTFSVSKKAYFQIHIPSLDFCRSLDPFKRCGGRS